MTLSEEARERLADVVELQPTKNSELEERWGMESGSEVHQYLESELKDLYYRDDDGLIRATAEAADLVDVEPGIVESESGERIVRVPALHRAVLRVLPDQDDEPASVVSVLHGVRAAGGDGGTDDLDPGVDEVREALRSLVRKGVVEKVQRTVPTYRLSMPRAQLVVETRS